MRKFQFKFQAVLQDRKRKEEEALIALSRAQRNYQAEMQRKVDLTQELGNARQRLAILANSPVRIEAFWAEQDYISGTKQRIIQTEQAILRCYRYVEKEMRAYLICKRRTRAMEILQEKALQEYKRSLVKQELKEMDDMNTMRFAHMESKV